MKRLIFVGLVFALLVLAGCQEVPVNQKTGKPMTIQEQPEEVQKEYAKTIPDDATIVAYENVTYAITCHDICSSHSFKTFGRTRAGYENPVCFCGDETTGQIWSFVM